MIEPAPEKSAKKTNQKTNLAIWTKIQKYLEFIFFQNPSFPGIYIAHRCGATAYFWIRCWIQVELFNIQFTEIFLLKQYFIEIRKKSYFISSKNLKTGLMKIGSWNFFNFFCVIFSRFSSKPQTIRTIWAISRHFLKIVSGIVPYYYELYVT